MATMNCTRVNSKTRVKLHNKYGKYGPRAVSLGERPKVPWSVCCLRSLDKHYVYNNDNNNNNNSYIYIYIYTLYIYIYIYVCMYICI